MRLTRQTHETAPSGRRTVSVLTVFMFIGLTATSFALVAVVAAAQDSVRDGDPGGGYPACETMPDWDAFNPDNPKSETKFSEFIFVFEHLDGTTTTICGTSRNQPDGTKAVDAYVPDAGGFSVTEPRGIWFHVSCSDIFVDGWTDRGRFDDTFGPHEALDPEWRIVRYTIDRYSGGDVMRCGETFTPLASHPTATTTAPTTTTTVTPTSTAPTTTTTVDTQVQGTQQLAATGNGSLVLLAAIGFMFLGFGGLAVSVGRPDSRRRSGR